jgi:hypothetical protein
MYLGVWLRHNLETNSNQLKKGQKHNFIVFLIGCFFYAKRKEEMNASKCD